STNPAVRISAASAFTDPMVSFSDPRLTEAAVAWLKDSEPEVRMAGVNVLTEYGQWNPKNAGALIAMLRDKDPGVRSTAVFGLSRYGNQLDKFEPTFDKMLTDKDEGVRVSVLELVERLGY